MSASLAFTEAMRLLEEEQFLQLNKKKKDPLKPKQPMSAFFMFRNERRAESKSGWEVIEEWNNMTEKQKKPYEKQNMEKYLEEIEASKQRKEEEPAKPKKEENEMKKLHKQDKKEEKTNNIIKKTKENRQKKKKIRSQQTEEARDPHSFYSEARKNLLEERLGINDSTLNALISVKWKNAKENGGLYSVRWFRVVPDEAKTIKSSKNQMSMDAATLTADR
ncbi:High mobility group B protein 13 [Camellia lanceoleosa]|uniref:High mobility group B protein 13 n=1 Tax=Camellia lanceoleosa TaxID=1840588 RepID=A0ACC0HTS7_9ERIC|nr:High mobility group B protein 13 [Camellia lanceoleosa]